MLDAARALNDGKPLPRPHPRYGLGGARNYIDAQIHGRIEIARDIDEVHISMEELDQLPLPGSKDRLLAWMDGCNTTRRWARQHVRWPDAPLAVPLATRQSLGQLRTMDAQQPTRQPAAPADAPDEAMLAKARHWPRFIVHRGGVDTGMLSDTGAD